MLSFYLAFLYSDRPYYDDDRILCMCEFLFRVQQKNRLEQKGVLRRFSISCYGYQHTLDDSRTEKASKFKTLKRGTKEYEKWFFKYSPGAKLQNKTIKKHKKKKPSNKSKNRNHNKKSRKRFRFFK